MIPTRWTLQILPWVRDVTSPRGAITHEYGPAVDWPVHGWYPGAMAEPADPHTDRSDVLWTVLAPARDPRPTERDRVVLGGVTYEVDGAPGDFTHGPWPCPAAGLVVQLKAVTG